MAKTLKELAFLRDLVVDAEWTLRFTELADQHLGFKDEKKFLYLNAGTGNHVIAIRRKMGKDAEAWAVCEDAELFKIARDKGKATQSKVTFSTGDYDDGTFSAVLADASFVRPGDLAALVGDAVGAAEKGAKIAFFTISSGSFGEVFSLLWEVFFNEELGENGHAAEELITELPTVSDIETTAEAAGLGNLSAHTQVETFEFKNGKEFVASPLVANFLLPNWLRSLKPKEHAKATKKLADLIDAEDAGLSFRFTVKATLVIGEKG